MPDRTGWMKSVYHLHGVSSEALLLPTRGTPVDSVNIEASRSCPCLRTKAAERLEQR